MLFSSRSYRLLMNKRGVIYCPNCGSEEVSKPRLSQVAFAISFLLLGFPLPFMSKKYHCFDCGHDFKKRRHNHGNADNTEGQEGNS